MILYIIGSVIAVIVTMKIAWWILCTLIFPDSNTIIEDHNKTHEGYD